MKIFADIRAMDRVDVGIGTSKDVIISYGFKWSDTPVRNRVHLRDHPKPVNIDFKLLNKNLLRITNNSGNVVSLWPGELFLTVVAGHPVYDALAEIGMESTKLPMAPVEASEERTATFTGTVYEVGRDITALHLTPYINEKLREAGYNTVRSLEGLDDMELESIPGLGKVSVAKVRAALAEYLAEEELQGWMTEWANDRGI